MIETKRSESIRPSVHIPIETIGRSAVAWVVGTPQFYTQCSCLQVSFNTIGMTTTVGIIKDKREIKGQQRSGEDTSKGDSMSMNPKQKRVVLADKQERKERKKARATEKAKMMIIESRS